MIGILLSDQSFEQDIRELLMAFCPGQKFTHEGEALREAGLIVRGGRTGSGFWLSAERSVSEAENQDGAGTETGPRRFETVSEGRITVDEDSRFETKNRLKRELYQMMSRLTGKELPWGTLTGIRPTKIALTRLYEGASEQEIHDHMKETYLTSEEKIALSLDVARREKELLSVVDYENGYSLYIGIPFCPTTCLYCSFTSFPIGKWQGRTELYLNALFWEMEYVAEKMRGRVLDTIYFGGGTPTSLSPEDLDAILNKVESTFPMDQVKEFTVEAGRPDTITAEKLAVLRTRGCTRVSVNPQTMEDHVLRAIGRAHTADDIRRAWALVREAGFPYANMDLIAGLPLDTVEGFRRSLDQVVAMAPENVTVHTLALKKGSRIMAEGGGLPSPGEVSAMLDYAWETLRGAGYTPYYLYRQKYMSGGFENVGWCRPGGESLYNICMMEELHTILSLGAGGVTKLIDPGAGSLVRLSNPKYPKEYIDHIDAIVAQKEDITWPIS